MKPSEYLIKEGYWFISNMPNIKLEDGEGYRVDSVADELDKRFIDREELKDKIKKIFRDNVQDGNIRDGCMDYYDLDIEKKILELLK